MTAEQQLERSVLEGKERDELRAIAQAMSLETPSRARKADIIDRILDAAGVLSSGSAANGDEPNGTANGAGVPGRARTATRRTRTPTKDVEGDSSTDAASGQVTGEVPATGSSETGSPAGATHADGSADNGSTGSTDAPSGAGAGGGAAGTSPGDSAGGPAGAAGSAASGEGRSDGGDGGDGDSEGADGRQGWSGQGRGSGGAGSSRQQDRQQDRQQGRHPQQQQQLVDAGNRRGRRRRGRERGGERELQGGAAPESYQGELVEVRGLLDLREEGYGFLRCDGYLPSSKDVYVSISQARRFSLRKGDYVEGACRPASNNEKYPALLRIDRVSGLEPEEAKDRPRFETLTPLFPDERLHLERPGEKENVTARIVDLLSPIGKGQRGLIVSPPKAGKTTVMKQIAHSIEANNPDVHLMVLLVDERPEEVTDMRRSVKGEVIASTFDRPSDEHTSVTELAIERAKRLVEGGQDVVIILDGITRLARAYNLAQPATGRIMSGGVDSGALYPPKKFFGAARNIEEGGSLTILATALVETGSKMDEVIFEEFKGTGNMELRLDRRLAERRLYPAIDVNASSTRHEELLFDRGQLQQVWKLRRVLNALAAEGNAAPGLELLMDRIRTTKSNDEFLAEIAKGPAAPT